MAHFEILMNLDDTYLEILAAMYRKHGDISYASSLLINGLRIKRLGWYPIRFMTMEDCWKEDGTFLVLIEYAARYELLPFTLNEHGYHDIYRGLTCTKRVHFGRPLVFKHIHHGLKRTLRDIIEEKELEVDNEISYYSYRMSIMEAKCFQTDFTDDIEMKELQPSDAELINSLWLENQPDSDQLVSTLIHMNGGYGLFSRMNQELLGWILKSIAGQVELVYVVEEHRKKGYGTAMIKKLVKDIAEDGEDPVVFVKISNGKAQRCFEKLGFANVGLCYDIILKQTI